MIRLFCFLIPSVSALLVISSCKKKDDEKPAPMIDSVMVYLDKKTPHDTVYFRAYANMSATIEWDFTDGTPRSSGDSVMHIFSTIGFFDVICLATANDRTSSKYVAVNNTPFTKVKVYSVTVLSLPLTNQNGGHWDSDLSGPDLQCIISLPGVPASQNPDVHSDGVYVNAVPSTSMNAQLTFSSLIINKKINSQIPVSIIDYDDDQDELIQMFTLPYGFRDYINQYPTDSNPHEFLLSQNGTSIKMKVQWLP